MVKICKESVTIPFKILFQESLKNEYFQRYRKKANVVLVHKQEDKKLIKNYLPTY